MERLILDTGVLVALERGRPAVLDAVSPDDDVALAAVTAAELLVRVQLSDGARRDARSATVEALFAALPIISYDLGVAREHAQLLAHTRRTGRPRGAHDLLIAATAASTKRTVLTTDASAFADLPGVMTRLVG